MPLYYFHVHNSLGFTRDEEGQELPDVGAALDVAVRSARSLLAAEVSEGRVDLRGRIDVTDEAGGAVLALPFADAIVLLTGDPPDT
jgi:hypothetical protein